MTVTRMGVLGLLAVASLTASACGQKSQEDLIKSRAAKLTHEWLELADWNLDYDEARAKAKQSGKPIFGYFSRSYAY